MSIKDLCIGLTEQNAKSLLNDHDTFLFDCDGVLWNLPDIFPGAVDLLNYLTEKGKRLFFVTNNSTKTQDDCAKGLNAIGYHAKPVS
jgi:4-nitrophenyl phosphatase